MLKLLLAYVNHGSRWDLVAMATLLLSVSPVRAVSLNFDAPASVADLIPGRPFEVDVLLAGLAAGEQLETLAVSVDFDASLLAAKSVRPGAILPDPLDDPLDYFASIGTRSIDVTFLTLGAEPADRIDANGVFFSITFVALTPDSQDAIAFSFPEVQQFNAAEPEEPLFPAIDLAEPLVFGVLDEPIAIPGDYDFNRTVDRSDFLIWKQSFASTVDLAADGNGNGVVDAADYTIWRDYLGAQGMFAMSGSGISVVHEAAGTGQVPELSGLGLIATGIAIVGMGHICNSRRRLALS